MQPDSPAPPTNNAMPPTNYDFIVNPPPPGRKLNLPGSNSMAVRALIFAGGLLVLLIVFIVVKNLISGSPKLDTMVTVAQDQQELVHVTTNAAQQPGLSSNNQNLAATAQLSLASNQGQLTSYLKNNGLKVSLKTLALKQSTSLDNQLTAAATAGTYNQTFQDAIKSQLATYSHDLQLAYQQIKGTNGRALLSSDYNQAQLLISQANSASATN